MTYKWSTDIWKMLKISNQQETANQNHTPNHTCKNQYCQNTKDNKEWRGCGTHTLLVEMYISTTFMKNSIEILQKWKIMIQIFYYYLSKGLEIGTVYWRNIFVHHAMQH